VRSTLMAWAPLTLERIEPEIRKCRHAGTSARHSFLVGIRRVASQAAVGAPL
jgi:hypothetical protein